MAFVFKSTFHCFQVELYAALLHDAVILYAIALNKTLANGDNGRNGTAIMANIINSTFEGIYTVKFIFHEFPCFSLKRWLYKLASNHSLLHT